jgi:hypothetical protein
LPRYWKVSEPGSGQDGIRQERWWKKSVAEMSGRRNGIGSERDEGKVEIERKLRRRREGNEYGNRRGFR